MLHRLSGSGNWKEEPASFAKLALDPHAAAVGDDNLSRNRKPQAKALMGCFSVALGRADMLVSVVVSDAEPLAPTLSSSSAQHAAHPQSARYPKG